MSEPTRGSSTRPGYRPRSDRPALLPDESAISAVTLAELTAGPATEDKTTRATPRPVRWAASTWDPLPFDAEAARVYGRMFAAARAARTVESRSLRLADLLIAATAAANSLPLYTRNPADFVALNAIIKLFIF